MPVLGSPWVMYAYAFGDCFVNLTFFSCNSAWEANFSSARS